MSAHSSGWEVDWGRRRRTPVAQVWARNPRSYQGRAREWHWTTYATLTRRGVEWCDARPTPGRSRTKAGYVVLSRSALTPDEIALADTLQLWIGSSRGRKHGVKEHQLVAAKKYGPLPPNAVVRHRNGRKDDNRPENLVLGTRKDNAMDHHRAVREMMYWRERALRAEGTNPLDAVWAGPSSG